MQASELYQEVATIFAWCYRFMQYPLFYLGSKPITIWNVCISLMMMWVFRSFLDILGIWGYGEDPDVEYDSRYDDD